MNRRFRPRKLLRILVIGIAGIFIFGAIIMLLWNALMPQIFNLRAITLWQALGLLVLAKILFSDFRGGGGPGGGWKKRALHDRWANMTPEERQKFKEEWSRRCGRPFPPDQSVNPGTPS